MKHWLLATCVVAMPQALYAITFNFAELPSTTNAFSVQQTVDGISVIATGYVAERDEGDGDATVIGPLATTSPSNDPNFGIDPGGLGLQLLAQQAVTPQLSGNDFGGGNIRPGFDGFSYLGLGIPKFDFTLLEFSEPVDVPAVTVDDVSNFGRSIWAAAGSEAPDFSQSFLNGLQGFQVLNFSDDATDGFFTHDLSFDNVRYLLIGAPPGHLEHPIALIELA